MNAGLTATLFTSIVLHLLGLTALSMVSGSLWPVTPPPNLIPTEMLVEPPPPVVSEPDPPPGAGATAFEHCGAARACASPPC